MNLSAADSPTREFIGIDWGTTRMRALRCAANGRGVVALDRREGPGVAAARGAIRDTLSAAIGGWLAAPARPPVILSGMIGSNIGWHEVPYLRCPVDIADLGGHCFRFRDAGVDFAIVPGVRYEGPAGDADVMRGEELQILGWLAADPARGAGEHLLCLPGSHAKWVCVVDGRIESIVSALTGELYAALSRHTVLFAGFEDEDVDRTDETAFDAGVAAMRDTPEGFLHRLFDVRSRQLLGRYDRAAALGYLSGLVIGADIGAALSLASLPAGDIAIVGEARQTALYARALAAMNRQAATMDGVDAALHGYNAIDASLR